MGAVISAAPAFSGMETCSGNPKQQAIACTLDQANSARMAKSRVNLTERSMTTKNILSLEDADLSAYFRASIASIWAISLFWASTMSLQSRITSGSERVASLHIRIAPEW